jgi:chitodextrinase
VLSADTLTANYSGNSLPDGISIANYSTADTQGALTVDESLTKETSYNVLVN